MNLAFGDTPPTRAVFQIFQFFQFFKFERKYKEIVLLLYNNKYFLLLFLSEK